MAPVEGVAAGILVSGARGVAQRRQKRASGSWRVSGWRGQRSGEAGRAALAISTVTMPVGTARMP